jgi:hypothetical protein
LLHGGQALEREVVIDTTVQEKNITFPIDTKLRVKVMGRCWKLAKEENMRLRRSYRRELKKVLRVIRFSKSTRDKKKVTAAMRQVKTMANALLRDVHAQTCRKAVAPFGRRSLTVTESRQPGTPGHKQDLQLPRTRGLLRQQRQGAQKV